MASPELRSLVCRQNHPDAQIFTPPYLFNPDGTPATRPVITAVTPTTVNVGGFITVTTAAPNATFSLMRVRYDLPSIPCCCVAKFVERRELI